MTVIGILLIGLVVGLLARFLTPGKTQGGILVTIAIGIIGSAVATYGGQIGLNVAFDWGTVVARY